MANVVTSSGDSADTNNAINMRNLAEDIIKELEHIDSMNYTTFAKIQKLQDYLESRGVLTP